MSGSNSNSSLNLFPDHDTNRATVMEWLNQAALAVETSERVQLLHKVQEFLLRKCPWLLSELLQDVLGYTADRNADVKKCIVGFIEEACKQDVKTIPKVIVNLHMLLCDESVQVQKRVIQASNSIYRNMITWLSKAQLITDDMEQAWNNLNNIKVEIVNMIDSDNDGVRTNSIKFLEGVVLLQTYPDPGALRKDNDFSLDDIPLTLKIARRRKLEEEANHIFALLVKFHGSPHISSVNLMACMGSLCTIARSRSEFMPKVIHALENLHSNLPPTLSHSQVSSVRKHLKLQLLNILKHPSSSDQRSTVVELLTELGCTNTELSKLIPRGEEKKRIQKRISDTQISSIVKKAKLTQEVEEKMIVESPLREKQAYEVNHQFVTDNLNINVATSIIFATIKSLPAIMPSLFQTEYTKYYENPNPATLSDVVKLLTEQITNAKLGPGAKIESSFKIEPEPLSVIEPEKDAFVFKDIIENKPKELKVTRQVRTRTKALKLVDVTKALSGSVKDRMLVSCVDRILQSEKSLKLSVTHSRYKIITTLASTFCAPVRERILMFLLSDIRLHVDLALAWLYEEYSLMQGFSRMSIIAKRPEKPDQSYNTLLCALVNNLQTVDLRDRDGLLARLFLEAPLVTDEALDCLKLMCRQLDKCVVALNLMHDLVVRRPPRGQLYLNALLEYCTFEDSMVREEAIARVLSLYERQEWQPYIEKNAVEYLDLLKNGKPPVHLFGVKTGRLIRADNWNDDLNRVCLGLYLALLPYNEVLIHELANVYTQTHADTKRTILRLLEVPIRGMGMDSTELLLLVEKCPKGSETMVTRIIHILSDRGPPSAQLVNRVRELYQSRVSDVRFLIPVLNGLTKKEVTAALPKLIKLNPIVVKEVFNRLLGLHGDSPITPTELLIALHVIDPSKAEIKAIMKATSLCFSEKQIFTQEVLAVVIQQLMEINPLPTLLMRTVIQSLSLYPRLTGFVMNILQRLITKQVWRQKVVWEGFIKCCQRTKPQSFQVILQLPPPQLEEALKVCPDIKAPLLDHIQSLTDAQRAHVPAATIEVLIGPTQSVPTPVTIPTLQTTASIVTITEETSNSSEAKLILDEPLPPGMD